MHEDTRRLVRELCSRAGMIMEDASATAVISAGIDDAAMRLLVAQVATKLEKAIALIAAAKTLVATLPNATGRKL